MDATYHCGSDKYPYTIKSMNKRFLVATSDLHKDREKRFSLRKNGKWCEVNKRIHPSLYLEIGLKQTYFDEDF